uniref:Uncharacterized protein n=1 Tax=Arion vulgaris TaxID=1028688 RepID=A0A0B6Z7I1_9EUPU
MLYKHTSPASPPTDSQKYTSLTHIILTSRHTPARLNIKHTIHDLAQKAI